MNWTPLHAPSSPTKKTNNNKQSVQTKYTMATGGEKNKMRKLNILKACENHQFGLVVKSKRIDSL